MPTYEYACKSCGHRFEAVQSFTDDALTACPACSGPLRKVFGNVGIAFKGSGFYKTDSRAGSAGTKGSTGGPASGADTGSASGSSGDATGSGSGSGSASSSSGSDSGHSHSHGHSHGPSTHTH
jgi:putative FmdB family regulatory protein